MDDTAIMGCIWDVQEEEYRSLVVTGFETDSGADPKSLARKTVCLFTLETPGDDTYTVWQGIRVRGSRVQEKGKLVQHKLLSSGVSLHTHARLVSQETHPGWLYRHAQKSLIRKRSQETQTLTCRLQRD